MVLVTDVAQIQFLAREIPHAMGVAPQKREKEREGERKRERTNEGTIVWSAFISRGYYV